MRRQLGPAPSLCYLPAEHSESYRSADCSASPPFSLDPPLPMGIQRRRGLKEDRRPGWSRHPSLGANEIVLALEKGLEENGDTCVGVYAAGRTND